MTGLYTDYRWQVIDSSSIGLKGTGSTQYTISRYCRAGAIFWFNPSNVSSTYNILFFFTLILFLFVCFFFSFVSSFLFFLCPLYISFWLFRWTSSCNATRTWRHITHATRRPISTLRAPCNAFAFVASIPVVESTVAVVSPARNWISFFKSSSGNL